MKHKTILILTLLSLTLTVYFLQGSIYFAFFFCFIILIYIAFVSTGSGFIQLNYFVDNINHSKNKGVALTFDDGPDSKLTPQLLDLLEKENIKATFFLIGSKVKGNEFIIKKIYEKGHIIGNHSFSHNMKLTYLSTNKLIKDFDLCTSSITKVIEREPRFFRPPFGITTPRYKRALKKLNLQSIGWNIRSFDTTATDKKTLYNNVIKQIKDGSILLFHDTQQITIEILPDIINYCRRGGIKIVPLSHLINQEPYV